MTLVADEKENYVSLFNRLEQGLASRPSLQRLRRSAIARFDELGFPTARNEDWKFTSLAPLAGMAFASAPEYRPNGLTVGKLQQAAFGVDLGKRLVFVNGRHAADLSSVGSLPAGVVVTSMAEALQRHPDLVELHLGRHAKFDQHAMLALNTALFRDGAFIFVPKNVVLREPIHLLFASTAPDEPFASFPRNLIVAGESSQLSVIENYAGLSDGVYFTNAASEVVVADNAIVDHYKLQEESEEAYCVAVTQVHLGRTSKFTSHYVGFGGALVRNEMRVLLDAEGGECTLDGLYMADGKQHMDNHTVMDHSQPYCASHELYKGILDDKAHGVFNGKIFVRLDAQKTDAKQTNQTLLLSEDATINTKPQLEIFADDVKCTHGATVGQLDANALFYLRSRGLSLQDARSLLIYAFANDVITRFHLAPLRDQIEDHLLEMRRLADGLGAKDL
jgi:Fe-S cluster assembly protein SufD